MTDVRVKICGLTTVDDVAATARAGAAYAGFVFFEQSKRFVAPERARALALAAPPGLAKVALVVDADDAALEAILAQVPIDILQLHGQETPQRVADLRARFGLPVMKALGVRDTADLGPISTYEAVADQILVDAKPPEGSTVPGGHGQRFDWGLLQGRNWARPWLLAGGLDAETVGHAIAQTGATQVDVSSGVECRPGVKDPDRIAAFVSATRDVAAIPNL